MVKLLSCPCCIVRSIKTQQASVERERRQRVSCWELREDYSSPPHLAPRGRKLEKPNIVRAKTITEVILERAGPIIFQTFFFPEFAGYRAIPPKFALSQTRGGGWQLVLQLKLPSGGYCAVWGYR